LDEIREEGYTVSDEDYLNGVGAVAAPVFGRTGTLEATVSLGGPAGHFRGSRLVSIISAVREAAATVSARLGSPDEAAGWHGPVWRLSSARLGWADCGVANPM